MKRKRKYLKEITSKLEFENEFHLIFQECGYILYWSRHCYHCKKLNLILDKLPTNKIHKVCVDDVNKLKLPKYVNRVPTLCKVGDNGWTKTDKKLFEWIKNILKSYPNRYIKLIYNLRLKPNNLFNILNRDEVDKIVSYYKRQLLR